MLVTVATVILLNFFSEFKKSIKSTPESNFLVFQNKSVIIKYIS